MASQVNRKRAFEPPQIPDRLYFKIGDVARLCGVETYVLRFWESQFPQLKPNKSGTGQRLYRRRDVELALDIKRLVHAQGYTLSGARTVLEQGQRRAAKRDDSQASLPIPVDQTQRLDKVAAAIGHARAELREIANLLGSAAVPQPPRRRSRLAPIRAASGTLFPS
jgi:DNA-binding transcriptional MerR regulator